MTSYLFNPPSVQSLPIRGQQERFPINRIFCVGRNYHAHAVEMGRPVDKSVDQAFYFTNRPRHWWKAVRQLTTHPAPTITTSRWNWCWPLAKRVFA